MARQIFSITPVDITPGVLNAWQNVNLAAHIPAWATGGVFHVSGGLGIATADVGFRKPGSTDDRHDLAHGHFWLMQGVTGQAIEIYRGDPNGPTIRLVGYTGAGIVFFTNGINISPGVIDAWVTVNLAAHVPVGTLGIICEAWTWAINRDFGIRMTGSTDNRKHDIRDHTCWPTIGINAARQVDLYQDSVGNQETYLLGYILDGVAFNINAPEVSLGVAGSYQDMAPISEPTGIYECVRQAGPGNYALRQKGSAEDIYEALTIYHTWAFIAADVDGIVQGKISMLDIDFYLIGGGVGASPTTTTDAATGVAVPNATLNGTLDADGGLTCDCGFEWGETVAYGNTTPTQSRVTGQTFLQVIAGLDPAKTYHFRAFATNAVGTSYGANRTFTTTAFLPTTTTDPATGDSTLNGTLDDDGGEACDCGFEWGLTVAYGDTTPTQSRITGQAFTQTIGGLAPGTTYHFRAFATNGTGTSYGADRTFATSGIPVVTTDAETGLGRRRAVLNGTLDDDGGEICDCGFEWGETVAYGNTTLPDSRTAGETFDELVTALFPDRDYHFRAWATNSFGTAYGADRTFTTKPAVNRAFALAREEL